jgi:hypothetical protein
MIAHSDVTVVILSNARNRDLKLITREAIDSCIMTCEASIIVLEQSQESWKGCHTIWMDGDFNYNQFANVAIRSCTTPYIVVSNNDVVFTTGWLDALLKYADRDLVSPKEPTDVRQNDIYEVTQGTKCGRHLSGWCFMISRRLWEQIGGLDEDFPFLVCG